MQSNNADAATGTDKAAPHYLCSFLQNLLVAGAAGIEDANSTGVFQKAVQKVGTDFPYQVLHGSVIPRSVGHSPEFQMCCIPLERPCASYKR